MKNKTLKALKNARNFIGILSLFFWSVIIVWVACDLPVTFYDAIVLLASIASLIVYFKIDNKIKK